MFAIETKKILVVALVLLAGMALRDWSMREIEHPPGILVPERPSQVDLENSAIVTIDSYRLKPRADIQIRARVLSREDYSWGDEADLSPVDLALGWGSTGQNFHQAERTLVLHPIRIAGADTRPGHHSEQWQYAHDPGK